MQGEGVPALGSSAGAIRARELRENFIRMSVCLGLNHGFVTTPLVYATSILEPQVAYTGNGLFHVVFVCSLLVVAVPVVTAMGSSRNGILLAMSLYCCYSGFFSVASLFPGSYDAQWALFLTGAACGGLAGSTLWTSQGAFFGRTASLVSSAEGVPREQVSAELSGVFAFWYLLFELVGKLGFSGLLYFGLTASQVGILFTSLGALATVFLWRDGGDSIGALNAPAISETNGQSKLLATVSLWKDPLIWILSPTNLAFGFMSAFMNGFVNSNVARRELGREYVGVLSAVTVLTAVAVSKVTGLLTARWPTAVLAGGGACFIGIYLLHGVMGCCAGWGWKILDSYVLMGVGRAVYESTNKAIFCNFFPGERTEGAFANCMMQMGVAAAVAFFLGGKSFGIPLQLVAVLSACMPLSYVAATALRTKGERVPLLTF